jgi:hypothetical protein
MLHITYALNLFIFAILMELKILKNNFRNIVEGYLIVLIYFLAGEIDTNTKLIKNNKLIISTITIFLQFYASINTNILLPYTLYLFGTILQ